MSEQQIHKGLAGIIADTTAISKVVPEKKFLSYRGYPVHELAEKCCFEEVAWLIWRDELPTAEQLETFRATEKKYRNVSDDLIDVCKRMPKKAHPMDKLRTAVSFLGMEDEDCWNNDQDALLEKSIKLFARLPIIVAMCERLANGGEIIAPRQDMSYVENFFHMYFGEVPEKEVLRAFDISLTLYAEHSFNASTFTARTIISSLSDIYSAVTGAIGSLKGPLHGGANEAVMHMMLEIGEPSNAEKWMRDALAEKRLVMGFGHRVYRHGDSRVPTMKQAFLDMAKFKNGEKWVEMYEILERIMVDEKGIHPNLDFPTGPAYYLMGFDIPVFTPIFVMSRITGWTAHIMEQLANNKLIRPLSAYNGPDVRPVPLLEERKAA